jgi:hypothetical protein
MRTEKLPWPAWPSPRWPPWPARCRLLPRRRRRRPAPANSQTLIFHRALQPLRSPPSTPKPDPKTGFGFGDELTFHNLLFAHGQQAGDEGGSCVIMDTSQALANCTKVIRLQEGTITAQGLTGPPPRKDPAVTGETGICRNAGWEAALVESGSTAGRLTLHLPGF